MKFSNLGPPCCMPRPKMMRNLWTLRGRLQYIMATIYHSQKATSKNKKKIKRKKKKEKEIDNEIKKEEPKGDKYIVGPYLRQRVENL